MGLEITGPGRACRGALCESYSQGAWRWVHCLPGLAVTLWLGADRLEIGPRSVQAPCFSRCRSCALGCADRVSVTGRECQSRNQRRDGGATGGGEAAVEPGLGGFCGRVAPGFVAAGAGMVVSVAARDASPEGVTPGGRNPNAHCAYDVLPASAANAGSNSAVLRGLWVDRLWTPITPPGAATKPHSARPVIGST